jgi:hypothetical protein
VHSKRGDVKNKARKKAEAKILTEIIKGEL